MEEKIHCLVEGCEGKVIAQGLCKNHYDAWRRGKTEEAVLKGGPFKKSERYKRKPTEEAKKRKVRNQAALPDINDDDVVVELTEAGEALYRLERVLKILKAAGLVKDEDIAAAEALEKRAWRK